MPTENEIIMVIQQFWLEEGSVVKEKTQDIHLKEGILKYLLIHIKILMILSLIITKLDQMLK